MMAADLSDSTVKIFSMCPGWVRTRLGGETAPRHVSHGAETAVWLALNDSIPSGGFYRDKELIPW